MKNLLKYQGSLNFLYRQKYYKLASTDSSRQSNATIPQEISFTKTLEEDDGATIFLIVEKQQKTILNFFLDPLIVIE